MYEVIHRSSPADSGVMGGGGQSASLTSSFGGKILLTYRENRGKIEAMEKWRRKEGNCERKG